MRVVKSLFVVVMILFAAAAFASDKPSIGVAEFTNETHASWWYSDVGRDLAGMLTNELASSGKFKIVERAKLGKVLEEQDLAEAGRINKKTGAKIGKLTGAQYLVYATVTAFDQNTAGTGGGIGFRGISIGGKKEEAYLAIDLRVVDTTTGEIEFTRTVEGRSTSYGVSGGVSRGGFSGGLGKYENTPTGKAIRGAIIEATEYLECAMVDKDDCLAAYKAKEKARRTKSKDALKIE